MFGRRVVEVRFEICTVFFCALLGGITLEEVVGIQPHVISYSSLVGFPILEHFPLRSSLSLGIHCDVSNDDVVITDSRVDCNVAQ